MLLAVAISRSVLKQVSEELGNYVYALVDPRTSIPFYVGKGRGLRHAEHLFETLVAVKDGTETSRKQSQIAELLAADIEPEVWILRYGLGSVEYTAVEAAVIDVLMTFPITASKRREARIPLGKREQLTNARREAARGHGITLLQTLIDDYAAPELTTQTPLLLVTLNGWDDYPGGERIAGGRTRSGAGYQSSWLVSSARKAAYQQIGESVSAWWRLSKSRLQSVGIEHVVAVHGGVTRGLFKIDFASWDTDSFKNDARGRPIVKSAFWFSVVKSGKLFDEVVGPFGHRVPGRAQGARNAVRYWVA